jgi:hypothetical protein
MVDSEKGGDQLRRVARLFRCTYGRDPSVDELADALDFVERGDVLSAAKAKDQLFRWQQLAQVLLMSNEFMFVD